MGFAVNMNWKKYLCVGCVYYTIFTCIILMISLAIKGDFQQIVIEPLWFLRTLLYAFIVALASFARKIDAIPAWGRIGLHALLVLGGFLLIFFVPFAVERSYSAGRSLTVIFVLCILYAVGYLIAHFISKAISKKESKTTESTYSPKYQK